MHNQNEKAALAERLRGQKLIIPDLHPVFAHWPCGQNKHYQVMKEVLDKRFAEYVGFSPRPFNALLSIGTDRDKTRP